ncbi:Prefoldin subunit [Carpediemonas membranifera]|uniref:Prefoldin subunit n=1 Tax=Carpediemonas membranifera TaxID=201153 RepID=A0A8J6E395_9EUKA|nr:Prefoldin subunit [Carpediemonas membranifera]|eukprot:KAG9395648.1 Prefoldin subunit [Carpediemonas membranifera]
MAQQEFYNELQKLQIKMSDHRRQQASLKNQEMLKTHEMKSAELTIHDIEETKPEACYVAVGKAYYMKLNDAIVEKLKGTVAKLTNELTVVGNSKAYVEKQISATESALTELIKATPQARP